MGNNPYRAWWEVPETEPLTDRQSAEMRKFAGKLAAGVLIALAVIQLLIGWIGG